MGLTKITTARVVLVCVIAVLVALPTIFSHSLVIDFLRRHDFIHSRQQFLELSFPNPNAVHDFVGAFGDTRLRFEVVSHLESPAEVQWHITATPEGGTARVIDQGEQTLAPAQKFDRTVETTVTCDARRTQVTVSAHAGEAAPDSQSIHFWVVQDGTRGGRTLCRVA